MSWFHRHKHKAVGVQRGYRYGNEHTTTVLLVCLCGDTTTELQEGWWTLNQVQGIVTDEVVSEAEEILTQS